MIAFSNLTPYQKILFGAVIVSAAPPLSIWALLRSRGRRPRLLRAGELELRVDNPEHLWGRHHDLEELKSFCQTHTIVFLEGASGSGKSALVQGGLIPELAKESYLHPILLEKLGVWDDPHLRAVLTDSVWNALDDDQRKRLVRDSGDEPPPKPEDIAPLLAIFNERLGRRPLLIFDQLHEFVLENLSHFQSPDGGWSRTADLMQYPFWRQLSDLIAKNRVHCLFVLRSDLLAISHSLHFTDNVKAFSLGPLDPGLLEAGVLQLARLEVVANRNSGFAEFVREFVKDLKREGATPGQLALALRSIAVLDYITVAEYNRISRLRGMEARYLQELIALAARESTLTPAQVLAILSRLAGVDNRAASFSPQSVSFQVRRPGSRVACPRDPWSSASGRKDREGTELLAPP